LGWEFSQPGDFDVPLSSNQVFFGWKLGQSGDFDAPLSSN
jgi:hypothetical protein